MKNKIFVLVVLFFIQSILYLINALTGYFTGATFGILGNAFVYSGIMGFIAYTIYFRRDKYTYFAAVFFSGLTLIRSVIGFGLSFYPDSGLPTSLAIFAMTNAIIFGITPLLLLSNKELRSTFLNAKNH